MLQVGGIKTAKGLGVSSSTELSEEERKALKNLAEVLREFVALRPNMPIHQVLVMLSVALDEGKSLKHYARALEYPPSTVSRVFLDNGPKARSGEEGLGLLEAKSSIANLREHETYLTVKGRSLFRQVARRLLKR